MGPQWDLLGAPGYRTAHGLDGDFVRPGGSVGLFVVCAVVGLPGVVVVGAIVGVGTTVGVVDGTVVAGVLAGVSPGVLVGVGAVSLGRMDSTAAGPGLTAGRLAGWATSGPGISGVSSRGPPSRLLAIRIRYPTAGTARSAPARRMVR
jgi:hypothetical protein